MTEQTTTDQELYGDDCPGVRGNTRAPRFGEWMRGVWASVSNPHRDGMFVRTERRTGRLNPGTWHELTDGKGDFWSYPAENTVFLTPQHTHAQAGAVPLTDNELVRLSRVGAIRTDDSGKVVLWPASYKTQMEDRFKCGWRKAEKYHGITKEGGQP